MNTLNRVIAHEYPKYNTFHPIYQTVSYETSSSSPDPPCFKEFIDLFSCLKNEKKVEECKIKYTSLLKCLLNK